MKVAAVQLKSSSDKRVNLQIAKDLGADFVLPPEMYMAFLHPKLGTSRYAEIAESLDCPFVSGLAECARENQVYVICGIFESKPGENTRVYNTTVFLGRNGELLQSYHKTHLYDAFNYKESDSM